MSESETDFFGTSDWDGDGEITEVDEQISAAGMFAFSEWQESGEADFLGGGAPSRRRADPAAPYFPETVSAALPEAEVHRLRRKARGTHCFATVFTLFFALTTLLIAGLLLALAELNARLSSVDAWDTPLELVFALVALLVSIYFFCAFAKDCADYRKRLETFNAQLTAARRKALNVHSRDSVSVPRRKALNAHSWDSISVPRWEDPCCGFRLSGYYDTETGD